jgi:hypothetical protein
MSGGIVTGFEKIVDRAEGITGGPFRAEGDAVARAGQVVARAGPVVSIARMTDELEARLTALAARAEGLGSVLNAILDRREGRKKMPKTMTVEADAAIESVLVEVMSRRAVTRVDPAHLRLDLGRVALSLGEDGAARLERSLYAAIGRTPRDPVSEERRLRRELASRIDTLAGLCRTLAARAFVCESLSLARNEEGGELLLLAQRSSVDEAAREAELTVRAIDGALDNREPIRVQAFAARALGNSKALPWSGPRFRRVCAALYAHDPGTRAAVHELGDHRTVTAAESFALEVHGIYRDVAAASALCFGPFSYETHGERFDHVARHAAHGECSRLVMAQLADAQAVRPAFSQVTLIENLTPFLDYTEALSRRASPCRELVICSSGQASWATVRILRMVAPFAVPVRHSGDLDRSGVLILRSLAKRGGTRITPFHMDVETHRSNVTRGIEMSAGEAQRLAALVARDEPNAACHALLREIATTGVWIEQEIFSDACLLGELD